MLGGFVNINSKLQFLLLCFFTTMISCQTTKKDMAKLPEKMVAHPIKKKKILILSCKGGCGHLSASQTLTTLLEKEYEILTNFPIESILTQYDPIKKITKKYTGDQFYNKMLQSGWTTAVNIYGHYFGPPFIFAKTKKLTRKFLELFINDKPDLIISVIPYLNLAAKNAADKLKIPFLLVSLDLDIYLWTAGLDKINKDKFTMTICDECTKATIGKTIKTKNINQIKAIGAPAKPEFFIKRTENDKAQIRKKWNIPDNKFTILLMMGGNGSDLLVRYAKKIAKSELPVHALICIGRKEELQKELLPIITQAKEQTTFTIVPFTNQVADLMSVSNLFITKAGGSSFNEAKVMKIPLLMDETDTTLYWERDTIKYAQNKKIAVTIQNLYNLKSMLKKFLDVGYYKQFVQAYDTLPKTNSNEEIVKIVHELCPK
jgi:processive 1,2-diacylglycerol beta-glucosyltransferase